MHHIFEKEMIVFYQESSDTATVVSLKRVAKRIEAETCETTCKVTSCIKPKSKCCNKYQKKGINCKRCPLIYKLKAVS